jgi:hypothetical protein
VRLSREQNNFFGLLFEYLTDFHDQKSNENLPVFKSMEHFSNAFDAFYLSLQLKIEIK